MAQMELSIKHTRLIERRFVIIKGKGGRMDWQYEIGRYKLLHLE